MKRICVYCGSNTGKCPAYYKSARALATILLERNIGLVYGGTTIGIMGEIADTMLAGGGEVIGIIPESLWQMGKLPHQGLTELKVVSSLHERKAMYYEQSDGFIALPGGLGTFEELFETLSLLQLGIHQKPCGVLNVDGYYDNLFQLLNHAVEEGFMVAQHRDMLQMSDQPDLLLDKMGSYKHKTVSKWLE